MKILVCLKQVPEKDSRYRIDETGLRIRETDLVFSANEADLCALEQALQLKEQWGGEVDVLCVGSERVLKLLKNALAMGADRAFHLNDPAFDRGDALLIAKVIAKALRSWTYDLILTGVQSDDMGYAQTGVILAQLLGWSHATIVVEIKGADDGCTLQVKRELENGWYEWIELTLPAVLTIQTRIKLPRFATLRGIRQAKTKEILTLNALALEFDPQGLGSPESQVVVKQLFFPERKKKTVMVEGPPREAARTLLELLRKDGRLF
jgi:electron transfer flavoprotein beta subunit